MSSSISVLDFLHLGSAISLRGFGRLGSSISVLDFLHLGSSVSIRGFGRIGSSIAVFDFMHLGSSLSLRQIASLGQGMSVYGMSAIRGTLSVHNYNGYTLAYTSQTGGRLVGDWLFGPIQRVPPGEYDLAAAQRGYAALLGDLDAMAGSAADAFDAKAYGPTSQGASGFEASGCYGLPTRLASSAIFFNNYGVRTMTD